MEFISLKGGVIMSVIAFSIVFIVIAALMLIMMSASKIARSLISKHKAKKLSKESNTSQQEIITPVTLTESSTDDNELIAAIIGAVIASNGKEVQIRSITEERRTMARPPLNSVWKISARTINHENCF